MQHGRAYLFIERGFDRLLAGYRRGLDFVLRHQRPTLVTFVVTVVLTIVLYVVIPKGFFPQQDTGIIVGLSDAPQDISFTEMVQRSTADGCGRAAIRTWPATVPFIGGNRPVNTGFLILGLKPRDQRKRAPIRSSSACAARSRRCRAPRCFCRPRRTSPSAAARPARSISTRCRTPTSMSSMPGRRSCWRSCRSCPSCATWPPISRPTVQIGFEDDYIFVQRGVIPPRRTLADK